MALLPPPNLAGVALPPPPQNPVIFSDIAPAVDYARQLNDGRLGRSQSNISSLILNSASGVFPGHPATAQEVGLAECYKAALVFAAVPPALVPVAPPWVQALQVGMNAQFANVNAQLAQITNDIAAMRHEQPILLANSQAGNHEPLYDPTVPGWVLLAPPHPTTRDQLKSFTREFLKEKLSSIFDRVA